MPDTDGLLLTEVPARGGPIFKVVSRADELIRTSVSDMDSEFPEGNSFPVRMLPSHVLYR